jgi:heptose-I-phosphate ethanolaminephosphotransferase
LAEAQLDSRNEERRDFDLEIMEEFPPMDSLTGSPTLLIVHLKGQHMEYKERYPKEFDLFKAEQFQVRYGGEQGRQMVAEYANATLYNDYVVDSICSLFKQQNAIAIYLADHGEEIYDWRDMFIRSNETDVPEVAHYQYEIPFIIYMSDVYKAQHETIVKEVEDAVDRPLISSDICHILFHLAGISCKEYRDSLNVLSPDYNMHTKRILRNTTDYDELMRSYSDKKQ